jgi:uncharacterized protein YgiM (DUF1202 family)
MTLRAVLRRVKLWKTAGLCCLIGCVVIGCTAHTPIVQRPTSAPTFSSAEALLPIVNVTLPFPVLVPTATPTPISSVRCLNAPPSQLIVHERGRVTRNNQRLNLREGPGTQHRVLTLLDEGLVFFVLGGPVCSGDFAWYLIRARGRVGWIAEGDASQYYAEPYLTG